SATSLRFAITSRSTVTPTPLAARRFPFTRALTYSLSPREWPHRPTARDTRTRVHRLTLPSRVSPSRRGRRDSACSARGTAMAVEASTPCLERCHNPSPGHLQRLRQHPALSCNRHEIGVPYPARQHVHVDVASDSGSGGAADVHAQVDAIGRINLAKHALHLLRQRHHLLGGGF